MRLRLLLHSAVAGALLALATVGAAAGGQPDSLAATPAGPGTGSDPAPSHIAPYQIEGDSIPHPLSDQVPDPGRGRRVALNGELGNCSICHALPLPSIPEDAFGNLGPSLAGIGNRLDTGQLRLRVVDPGRVNPGTVMPAYHRVEGLHRVHPDYQGQPILNARQVEDLVAWLSTLTREDTPAPQGRAIAHGTRAGETARSGYSYLGRDLRALQDDPFANPGLLWLDQGRSLWHRAVGPRNRSCASCHGDARQGMRGVAARYPAFDTRLDKVINLEQRINRCRRERQGASMLAWESPGLLALTLLVTRQSRGMPVAPEIDANSLSSLERGRALFQQRLGQLNLSCAHCHDMRAGQRLRGEVISQGQVNGFPVYRLMWDTLASTQRMFAWCNDAVRAAPWSPGSQAYVDLELFLKWRGRGLAVEAPAVRR